MKILCFDTETTGLPRNYKALITDVDNWPRLVEIGWVLMEDDGKVLKSVSTMVKPNGFAVPDGASKVHGITTEKALKEGRFLDEVLDEFIQATQQADVMVGHNIDYDMNILGAEMLRREKGRIVGKPIVDTMKASTNYCEIPGPRGYKWPKLAELYQILFKQPLEEAHHALADVETTIECYFELVKLGVIPKWDE